MKLNRINHLIIVTLVTLNACNVKEPRQIEDFTSNWKFHLGDDSLAYLPEYTDTSWRELDLPHDWSIEGKFSEEHPTGQAGGGLPAGIGWYRKSFKIPEKSGKKKVFIEFDGIYRNSEVWINGQYLGKRPNGYISFHYELSPYLKFGEENNIIAVKVDNSLQPNSRWYTGSGIYRNVRLVTTNGVMTGQWGAYITTPEVSTEKALVNIDLTIFNLSGITKKVEVETRIYNQKGKEIAISDRNQVALFIKENLKHSITVKDPVLWSVDKPYLYKAITTIYENNRPIDIYKTTFGIRYFQFDAEKGFSLNGQPMKIFGVCNHHDLGALGAAVNKRAIERQLDILKEMGCNAIRTAHNPPAPELLDLCDQMGFLVIDEAFDVWKKKKMKYDYHLEWDEWHQRDLQDMVKRDRNHPCIIMWSIGNEIREQFDSTGIEITRELVKLVKDLDTTRPVTCALTENIPEKNFIYQSGALDILSFNYKQNDYKNFPEWYPGKAIIASETSSAYASRGVYNMPSDSLQKWPEAYNVPLKNPNPDFTVSAYDHIHAFWGSTHEATWKFVKKYDFITGIFVWSGFDFLGEPVPYGWPARSSYYGVIDLAGFPKDAYYMYQSEWTDKPVLHLFPHWNWQPRQIVDVWAYYNCADEVELFLNERSLGTKSKNDSVFHVMWRVPFEAGIIKAISRKNGKIIKEKEIRTAGIPAKIEMIADNKTILANGKDLCFITVNVVDEKGNLVPTANNLITFKIDGPGEIVGTDNGYQAGMESFKTNIRKAFNGKCLLIVQSTKKTGFIEISAFSSTLQTKNLEIKTIFNK